jgi:hypothetical protein
LALPPVPSPTPPTTIPHRHSTPYQSSCHSTCPQSSPTVQRPFASPSCGAIETGGIWDAPIVYVDTFGDGGPWRDKTIERAHRTRDWVLSHERPSGQPRLDAQYNLCNNTLSTHAHRPSSLPAVHVRPHRSSGRRYPLRVPRVVRRARKLVESQYQWSAAIVPPVRQSLQCASMSTAHPPPRRSCHNGAPAYRQYSAPSDRWASVWDPPPSVSERLGTPEGPVPQAKKKPDRLVDIHNGQVCVLMGILTDFLIGTTARHRRVLLRTCLCRRNR